MATMPLFTTVILTAFLLLTSTNAEPLTRFRKCNSLEDYYRKNALSRVGPYGIGQNIRFNPLVFRGGPGTPEVQILESAPQSVAAPKAPVAGEDFSETNVQVEGVDEPDIIKTDGKRVFVIRGKVFSVVEVTNDGSDGLRKSKLELPTAGREMMVEGDKVLVISQEYKTTTPKPVGGPVIDSIGLRRPFFPIIRSEPITVVYQISVIGNIARLVTTLRMQGRYISAREVDGTARLILSYDPSESLHFTYPSSTVTTEQATAHNKRVVQAATYRDWLPTYTVTSASCTGKNCASSISEGVLTKCRKVYHSEKTFSGFKHLVVVTVPVTGFLHPLDSVSIASEADNVYATSKAMYVTTGTYRWDFPASDLRWGSKYTTSLHKFRLRNSRARYVGSGVVTGSVLNQFSMHEYKGVFFVATTEGATWWNRRDASKSKVSSFIPTNGGRTLAKIGEVGNLGIGERIYSVRYVANTAYVVTFRQVDPLYIIDLSNPSNLVVTGELKIPGFSSYLHPVAPGRILGVGQEATLEGRTTGAKVTLFDVRDVTRPTELASWTLKGSYTNAQWDHRAFLYWEPEGIAVMPISVYNSETRFTGSIVLDISDKGIRERGRITHSPCCGSKYTPGVERNMVLGKDHLWSLSRERLQVNGIRDLAVVNQISLKL